MLYNGTNTRALRELNGRFTLSKLLENKHSLIINFYNKLALTIGVFCLILSIISYISTFSENKNSNFLN